MGTDIYLVWDGMTEEDRKRQCTGFSLDSGDRGYLRASVGMIRENIVLAIIFPEKYWNSPEPLPYKFKENWDLVVSLGASYIVSVLTDTLPDFQIKKILRKAKKRAFKYYNFGKAITEAIKKVTGDLDVRMPTLDFPGAVIWLRSLFMFFGLGIKLEQEGKNPKIYISA